MLVTAAMVAGMTPGSVIVDLAAEQGGNCEGSVAGQTVDVGGVTIIGPTNVAASVPHDASLTYAKNIANFVALIVADKALHVDVDDVIVQETVTTHDGQVVHPRVRDALGLAPLPAPLDRAGTTCRPDPGGRQLMITDVIITSLFIFAFAGLLGLELIRRVPKLLHTPLMALDERAVGDLVGRVDADSRRDGHDLRQDHGLHRGGRLHDQRGRRVPDHRQDAQDVQEARARQADGEGGYVRDNLIQLAYLVAAIGFALSLKWMSSAPTARRGIFAGEAAFALAIVATLFTDGISGQGYALIASAMLIGAVIGVPLGLKVPMTAMPQRIALSHAFGALAAGLVGIAHYYLQRTNLGKFEMAVLGFEIILGCLVFTGSLMAAGKLQELLPQRPITFKGQNYLNFAILGAAIILVVLLVIDPSHTVLIPPIIVLSLTFRRLPDHPDRRRRHADRHRAVEQLRGHLGRRRWASCSTTNC